MRQSAHSLRLAVSLLLGAMFVALPVVSTAQAAISPDILHTQSYLSPKTVSRDECPSQLPETMPQLYAMLTPARFERVDKTIPNAVVITQPNSTIAHSISPSKTVLKRVDSDELTTEEVIQVTPAPVVSTSSAGEVMSAVASVQTSPAPSGSVLNAEVLFNMVNAYRVQVGLPPFEKDSWICSIAASRAPELDGEIWVTHTMHAGFYARNLPVWATENVISMRTEQEALTWWLNSPVHRAALLGNYKYACVACAGKSCGMIFSNLDPKYVQPQAAPSPSLAPIQ